MAAPTNTTTTLVSVGIREDLEGAIYRVAPEEVPFCSNIGTATAKATTHEWQLESLASPSGSNAALEGDDVSSLDAPNLTTRVKNICQIFRKTGGVSETNQAVNEAGRNDEMDRQKVLKGLELKRDIELSMMQNVGSRVESGGNARLTAGALACITTNTSVGSGGSNGGYSSGTVTAATNGTLRTWTEALLKAGMASAFSNGGRPTQLYVGPTQKQETSSFTGIADIRAMVKGDVPATIIGAADVYVSDFGKLTIIPHPYALTRDALAIDPKFWAVATLRPAKAVPLAKTGDSDRFKIAAEKALVFRNEKSSIAFRDLQ